MQHDEVIWSVINHGHCSFKAKLNNAAETFCRNEYNVSGLCNRTSCPLANSRYATVLEKEGVLYQYTKTIERAHTPKKLWERIELSADYAEALKQIDTHLQYWPKFMVHKSKQRLTKITQYLIRVRNLRKKNNKRLVTVPRRTEKRDLRREVKAEQAAKLDNVRLVTHERVCVCVCVLLKSPSNIVIYHTSIALLALHDLRTTCLDVLLSTFILIRMDACPEMNGNSREKNMRERES